VKPPLLLPLLLLDVDGPLNPYAADDADLADGYQTHRLIPSDWSVPIRVRLNPAHGPMLVALAGAGLVELAWATTWNQDANSMIAPLIGLPELPVVPIPHPAMDAPRDRIWKRDPVEQFADGRPLAWFDDDFVMPGDARWAQERTAGGAATLLVPVEPRVGLVQGDVDRVSEWARQAARA
jgi:hypothetical protein